MSNKYFFCYDKKIMKYLKYDNGIPFITSALHEKTGKKFWLFEQSSELKEALSKR